MQLLGGLPVQAGEELGGGKEVGCLCCAAATQNKDAGISRQCSMGSIAQSIDNCSNFFPQVKNGGGKEIAAIQSKDASRHCQGPTGSNGCKEVGCLCCAVAAESKGAGMSLQNEPEHCSTGSGEQLQ